MASKATSASEESKKAGVFARILVFIKQVLAELKKVVWPTKDELKTYFAVVIVFVLFMTIYTGIVDLVFTKLVTWVYGG